jgi:hypothetical protein
MRARHFLPAFTAAGVAITALCVFGVSAAWASRFASNYWTGCASSTRLCTEVDNAQAAFGHYVGHDEPSVLFYSHVPGSGTT